MAVKFDEMQHKEVFCKTNLHDHTSVQNTNKKNVNNQKNVNCLFCPKMEEARRFLYAHKPLFSAFLNWKCIFIQTTLTL